MPLQMALILMLFTEEACRWCSEKKGILKISENNDGEIQLKLLSIMDVFLRISSDHLFNRRSPSGYFCTEPWKSLAYSKCQLVVNFLPSIILCSFYWFILNNNFKRWTIPHKQANLDGCSILQHMNKQKRTGGNAK